MDRNHIDYWGEQWNGICEEQRFAESSQSIGRDTKTILSTTGEVVELVIGYKRCDYFSLSFSSTDYPEV